MLVNILLRANSRHHNKRLLQLIDKSSRSFLSTNKKTISNQSKLNLFKPTQTITPLNFVSPGEPRFGFSEKKPKKQTAAQKAKAKREAEEEARRQQEMESDPYEEDPWKEEKEDLSKAKKDEGYYSDEENIEQKKEFKTYRRVLFNIWRAFKAVFWGVGAWFMYHLYHVIFSKDPQDKPAINDRLLFGAYFVHDSYIGLRDLLTKPPVNSLLFERPPIQPGY